jgi:hypothetical protein
LQSDQEPPDPQSTADDWSRWVRPGPEDNLAVCCGCGLAHRIDYRIGEDGGPEFRVRVDHEATELERAGELKDVEQL